MYITKEITSKQRAMIFGLKSKQDISDDTLHKLIYNLTKKSSLTKLTTKEAGLVIDELIKKGAGTSHLKTNKQIHYLLDLAKKAGFTTDGKLDEIKLNSWILKYYAVYNYKWLDKSTARKVIEGLKVIIQRKNTKEVV